MQPTIKQWLDRNPGWHRALSNSQFRERLARHLYDMFEMRTSRPWDQVGEEGAYPEMHTDWLDCADELIERMSSNGPG